MLGLTLLLALVPIAFSAPILDERAGISFGISFSPNNILPLLTLPYATYRASDYNVNDDYYTFSNIRFAAPPTGDLRWQKTQPPLNETGIQDGSVGFQCMQSTPNFLKIAYPLLAALEPSSEDCLFLDVLVPGAVVRGKVKNLPVGFWIFGGGYSLGSKSFFLYDGRAFLKSAANNMIYVAPNYRLGAFGFLAGPTVESEGTVNAGFYDQRAALQWVQDYIGLLGGDKTTVTAMGESAGAGSIVHHLISNRGTQDPLFKRAIIQSPAFEPEFDPARLETAYASFSIQAGCGYPSSLDCLRGKTTAELDNANRIVVGNQTYGTFGFGPSVDGVLIHDLPGLEFAAGNYWKDMSIIVSHNSNEGYLFAATQYADNNAFDDSIDLNFPNCTDETRAEITEDLYPPPGLFKKYATNYFRTADVIGQWVIDCNVRFLAKAYPTSSYVYLFSIPPGIHAIDTLFTFWRSGLSIGGLDIDINIDFLTAKNLATGFQSYLTSFIQTGDPNPKRELYGFPPTINFPKTSVTSAGLTVLNMGLFGFSSKTDSGTDQERCDFWQSGAWTGRPQDVERRALQKRAAVKGSK